MSVTIMRNTGFLGMVSAITIKVNGEKVAKVRQDKHVEIVVPHDNAQLSVSQFGTKSNVLEVQDGDAVEITTAKWSYISFGLVFVLLMLLSLAATLMWKIIVFTAMVALSISGYFMEGLHISKKF